MSVLGVDPGASGAFALLDGDRVETLVMPLAGKDIDWAAVAGWIRHVGIPDIAYVEKVGAMPKQGVSSTFRFGLNTGGIHGVLGALGIPMELVTPQRWKKVVLRDTARDKKAAIAYCRRRWPHLDLRASERCRVPHDGVADSLAIAEFGRRERG